MRLIDLIKLFLENKDLIFQIIEIIKQLIGGTSGVITIQSAEVLSVAAVEEARAQGLGDNAIEIIKLIFANWEAIQDLIKLFRGQ